jgi:hypothetical protein
VFSFVMEMQQWVPFALLLSYKIFWHVNNNKYLILKQCVCIHALIIQYANCMCYAVYLWLVSLCHIFPHYLIKGTIFWNKNYWA